MQEIFKSIPHYSNYQVSNIGRVKSLSRWSNCGHNGQMKKEIILTLFKDSSGYYMVKLYKNGKSKTKKVHQLVTEAFLNHKPNGNTMVVNHKNFIRTDNRLDNLEIVSMRENGSKKQIKSSSKYVGVSWNKYRSKWTSQIHIDGTNKYLGLFEDELDAHHTYQKALSKINSGC